ncbi:MAG: PatA/PatG family cyanobactin maturation protease [Acidobacteria bacterium]|nr:PatA/PatG family cyanobactin maturation protease [Acidobacteriota bacterium]
MNVTNSNILPNKSNDPLLLGLDELWRETLGNSSICIAVLDGQVDLSHPCFIGANLKAIDTVVSAKSAARFPIEHGTNVASIIFGTHKGTVRGIAPYCRGLSIPVFGSNADSSISCSQLDLARAISLAVQHGAHIINISGGQLDNTGQAEPLLADAIRLCAKNNVLIIAAAGNNGCECLHIPAALPSVLAVGAMDRQGSPLESSNWGKKYQVQGVLAPGQNILVATPGGETALRTGTSFATPIVSGIVALLLSIQLKQGLKINPSLIRQVILDTATGCGEESFSDCQRLLAGRINIIEALKKIKKGENMSEQRIEASQLLQVINNNSVPVSESIQPSGSGLSKPNESSMMKKEMSIVNPLAQSTQTQSFPGNSSIYASSGVFPSGGNGGCGCGGNNTPPSLAYVLGQIGYDFGTEARRDSFLQQSGKNTDLPTELLAYVENNPAQASGVIWTLNQDTTPIYAIQPLGPFATIGYDRLREFLKAQQEAEIERVSIPGVVSGKVTLLNGHTIPVLFPDVRGMYSWSTGALVNSLVEGLGEEDKEKKIQEIHNFLARVYYEIRNLGLSSQDRAINYAATNAFQVSQAYRSAIKDNMTLDTIGVERSPICRLGSDCWDVKLTFFNPSKRFEQARRVYRFTVDVSDIIPVSVGTVRDWHVY